MVVRNQDEGRPIRMIASAVPVTAVVSSCALAVLGGAHINGVIPDQGIEEK